MNKNAVGAIIIGIATLSLAACSSPGKRHDHHSGKGPDQAPPPHQVAARGDLLLPGFEKLNLSDAQKTEILRIMEANRPNNGARPEENMRPDRQAERTAEQALLQNKTFDEAAARELIARQEEASAAHRQQHADAQLQRLKTQHAVFQVLTPEQQQKWLTEQQRRPDRRKGHGEGPDNRRNMPPRPLAR